ncbi:MAG: chloride channel protein, partial [Bdellovibrionota bacterium]
GIVYLRLAWVMSLLVLGIGALGMMLQRFILDRRPGSRAYDGLADLFIHIHSPSAPDSPLRWALRGTISFALAFFGGAAGPEGAAIEWAQALALRMRARSSRWFEARRRTDASSAISAGVAAAFGAPFAGLLLPVELGIGGRTLSSVTSALAAFLFVRLINTFASIEGFDVSGALSGFNFQDWREWAASLALGALSGTVGAFIVRFVRYSQDSLLDLFQTQAWMRTMCGAILLFLVVLIYRQGHFPAPYLLEQVLWSKRSVGEVGILLFMGTLSLALVLSAFGTLGLLWPLFALGGFLGVLFYQAVLGNFVGDLQGFNAAMGLAGAASLWGAVLGAPLSGALIAFEMTQNLHILFPVLIAALTARFVRGLLRTPSLVDKDLEARGIRLIEGRSAAVLDGISVSEAMITDHETVHEQEPVSELYSRLLKSRYPFMPVISAQGTYVGLLTVDMVQDAWQKQGPGTSNSPLSKLLEAKDLLYRSGFQTRTIKSNDRLSATGGLFEDIPCVPVLGGDNRVLGLLFVYHVRLAYDREVARRSLTLENPEP